MKYKSRNKTKNKVLDVIQTVWDDDIKNNIASYPYIQITRIQDEIHDKIWRQIKYNIFLKIIHD